MIADIKKVQSRKRGNQSKQDTLSTLSIQDLGMKISNFNPPQEIVEIGAPLTPGKKALVVDNDAFFVEFLSELLEEGRYEVIKASDGKEGMDRLRQEKIDIMFVDLIMPKIDGWQLIKYTRKKYPGRWFPIVAVSGTIIEQLDNLESIGADYYIAKGPMEKMKIQFNDFIKQIEAQPYPIQETGLVVVSEDGKPKQEAVELMQMVNFQKAILDGLGFGLLVCDRDTRVIMTDKTALTILDQDDVNVLNKRISTLFIQSESKKLVRCMRDIYHAPNKNRSECVVNIKGCRARFIVNLLFYNGEDVGWVLALEERETCQ